MKKRNIEHPKFYLKVLNYADKNIKLQYIDNEFTIQEKRKIKEEVINNDFSIDESEIINKLNRLELNKLNRYMRVQKKILNHYKKNQNFDSYSVVNSSIKLMLKFKEQYNF